MGITNFYEHPEDITIFIPEVVERSDDLILLPSSEATNPQLELVLTQYKHFTNKLSSWYSDLHDLFPALFGNERENTYRHPDFDFGPSYQFSCFWVAHALMHYWGVRILLFDALAQTLQWKYNLPFQTRCASRLAQQYPPSNNDQTHLSQHTLDTIILTSLASSSPVQAYTLIRDAQYVFATNIRKSLRYIWSSDFGTVQFFAQQMRRCLRAECLRT